MDALFIIDTPDTLNPDADSSYVMITEALRRGHQPWGTTLEDLLLDGNEAVAHAHPLVLSAPRGERRPRIVPSGASARRALSSFAVVLMRTDPPFDQDYLTATWCLDLAREQTLVLNDPRGLRDLNEKLSILSFPDLIPPTKMLRRPADLRAALAEFGGKMVVKPVFGFGGREVFRAFAGDPNLGALFEVATRDGTQWTIAQAFLQAATEGDKRVLLVDGEPIGAVTRVPAPGEARNNFHAGGRPAYADLSARDREICSRVGPFLSARGQFFVGLDIIGDLLTEINVTSPTGMQEINELQQLENENTMQAVFWLRLEAKLSARAHS
ncbi:MAG: glutathione synthase [Nannocystaceae bacterium]